MRCAIAAALLFFLASPGHAKLYKLNLVALDAQDQPATRLTAADFKLFEDGKTQPIVFCHFTGAWPLPTKPVTGEYSNRSAPPRHATVILIDLLTDQLMSDSIIGGEVVDALKDIESPESIYLYILTAKGELYPIHPIPNAVSPPEPQPWTVNVAPLMRAALKALVGLKPVDDRDIKFRYDLTMAALRDLGSRMTQLPGRTNLVWITHGIPLVGYSLSLQSALDFTNPLRWFSEELEQAQIVVYTVQQSLAGAEIASRSAAFLAEMTSLTGGRDYSSDRAADAIRQTRLDSRANYQIAYDSPSLNGDGKHHKIRITCARKGVRLQTEHGFYAVSPLSSPHALSAGPLRSRELPREMSTVTLSAFDATSIGLRVTRGADFEIHLDPATLLPQSRVQIAFVSYAVGPNPLPHPIVVTLAPGQFDLRESIPVAPDVVKLRVIAFDPGLGSVGSVTVPLHVSASQK